MELLLVATILICFISVIAEDPDICKDMHFKCNNCTELELCLSIGMPPTKMQCSHLTPYCSGKSCSEKPSSECATSIPSKFNCPIQDGHYPDPYDCGKYHICVNGIAVDYDCDSTTVFNTLTHSCVRRSLQNPCTKVNCKGNVDNFVTYTPNPRFAFFCISEDTIGPMVMCAENQEFDLVLKKCKPHCTAEGLLPDPDDEKNFFECTLKIGTIYIMTPRKCPNTDDVHSVFDPINLQCVSS